MSSSAAGTRSDPDHGRWKHGAIPVIGLIGGIGAGKSSVADLLESRGAVVIDADAVGHEVLRDPEVIDRLVGRFGPSILRPAADASAAGRAIDRRALGAIVFADPAALRDLEAVVHPRMFRNFEQLIREEEARGDALLIVLDAAILLETGWDRFCDLVIFIDASAAVRLDRVSRVRGWTAGTLKAREAVQWHADTKQDRADVVLRNESGLESLEAEVDGLVRSLIGGRTAARPPRGSRGRNPERSSASRSLEPVAPVPSGSEGLRL
jgi:dephospho-CoA kinase